MNSNRLPRLQRRVGVHDRLDPRLARAAHVAATVARIATEQRNRIDLAVAERHSVIALGFNPMNRRPNKNVSRSDYVKTSN